MQFISLVLTLVLLAQFTIFSLPANADTITYNPKSSDSPATMEGKVSVNKVGNLMMKDAYAFMHGNQVNIVGKSSSSGNSEGLLSGSVIAAKVHTSGSTTTVTGTAFFASGTALATLGASSASDTIATVGGGSVSGHIVSVSASDITVQLASGGQQQIALAEVVAIKSPTAYTFKISGKSISATDPAFSVNANTITFAPTTSATVATVSSSGHHMGKHKKVIVFVALLLIATAIAVPIAVAVPLASGHGGSANTNFLNQYNLVNFIKQRQAITPQPFKGLPQIQI